jgi:hypothetical protein
MRLSEAFRAVKPKKSGLASDHFTPESHANGNKYKHILLNLDK